jgi:hypothetical protein
MLFLYIVAAYALPAPTMEEVKARLKTDAMMAGVGAVGGGAATRTWYGAAIGAGIGLVTSEATHIFNKWRSPKVQAEAQKKFDDEQLLNSQLYGGAQTNVQPTAATPGTAPASGTFANSQIHFTDDGRAYMVDPTGANAPIEVKAA